MCLLVLLCVLVLTKRHAGSGNEIVPEVAFFGADQKERSLCGDENKTELEIFMRYLVKLLHEDFSCTLKIFVAIYQWEFSI